MIKKVMRSALVVMMVLALVGCNSSTANKKVKIGVSFGVGAAVRWQNEKVYMEEKAKELGIDIEARLNMTDTPKTQQEDCFELIDSGIDVLILIPRDVNKVKEIIDYAKEKDVKVISYARVAVGDVDLYVGYDSTNMGQSMGQYISEKVYQGDYILLKGDENDFNTSLLYNGAMKYIDPIKDNINILLDDYVPKWSPDTAKEMVKEAIIKNNNKIDAILAPNDAIAGACATALEELGITSHVVITGMDRELSALQRIVKDKQDMTIYIDLKNSAYTAIEQANNMALGKEVKVNASFDNGTEKRVDAYLVNGQVIVKENIQSLVIDKGYFTKEEIYQ